MDRLFTKWIQKVQWEDTESETRKGKTPVNGALINRYSGQLMLNPTESLWGTTPPADGRAGVVTYPVPSLRAWRLSLQGVKSPALLGFLPLQAVALEKVLRQRSRDASTWDGKLSDAHAQVQDASTTQGRWVSNSTVSHIWECKGENI